MSHSQTIFSNKVRFKIKYSQFQFIPYTNLLFNNSPINNTLVRRLKSFTFYSKIMHLNLYTLLLNRFIIEIIVMEMS